MGSILVSMVFTAIDVNVLMVQECPYFDEGCSYTTEKGCRNMSETGCEKCCWWDSEKKCFSMNHLRCPNGFDIAKGHIGDCTCLPGLKMHETKKPFIQEDITNKF